MTVISSGAAEGTGAGLGAGIGADAIAPDPRLVEHGLGEVGQADARAGGQAARPQLLRALNEQLLLSHIRRLGRCSRADLARLSGLSKPTVSLALANVERSGLVREAGQRTGVPGRSALLYEIRPDAGYVLGLDIGQQYLRGALADLSGQIIGRATVRSRATSVTGRVAELVGPGRPAVRRRGHRPGRR